MSIALGAACSTIGLVAGGVSDSPRSEDRAQAIANISSEHAIPAAVVAFVEDGAVSEVVSIGVSQMPEGQPIASHSIFQIASVSKVFTGILANQLIEEGKLGLSDPVTHYLPASLSDEARVNLDGVTVEHVLHHRSGLPRDTQVNPREGNDPMLVPMSEADLLADLAMAEMAGEPGERFEYSNLGYGLLGYVLERASGQAYEQLLASRITEPHGLRSTGTNLKPDNADRLVTPYRKEDPIAPTEPWRTGKLVAASGLYSTAEDLAQLMTAQLGAFGSGSDGALVTTANAKAVGDGRDYGYGMNVQPIELEGKTVNLHFHSGDMDGYAAFYGFVPSLNSGVVLLVSRGGDGKTELQRYALRQTLGV